MCVHAKRSMSHLEEHEYMLEGYVGNMCAHLGACMCMFSRTYESYVCTLGHMNHMCACSERHSHVCMLRGT